MGMSGKAELKDEMIEYYGVRSTPYYYEGSMYGRMYIPSSIVRGSVDRSDK